MSNFINRFSLATRLLCCATVCALFCTINSNLAQSSPATNVREHQESEVRATFERFVTAFNNLDWDNFHVAFAEDVTVFNPDIPEAPSVGRLDGRAQVEAGFRAVFEVSRRSAVGPPYLHIQPRNIAIQLEGTVAILTFEFDRDGNSVGRRTIVFRRRTDGWKIIHIHASNTARR